MQLSLIHAIWLSQSEARLPRDLRAYSRLEYGSPEAAWFLLWQGGRGASGQGLCPRLVELISRLLRHLRSRSLSEKDLGCKGHAELED